MKRILSKLGVHGAVIIAMIIVTFPFYWIVHTSLQDVSDFMLGSMSLLPKNPTFRNYAILFRSTPFINYLLNSLGVSLVTMVITLTLSSLAAYALSRCDFAGKNLITGLILSTYLFPGAVLLVPTFLIVKRLGIYDNLLSLVLVYVTTTAPFATILMRSFFDSLPRSLEEAAMVDGATRLQAVRHILVPLSTPGLASVGMHTLVTCWSEYTFAMMFIVSDHKKTLPVGISRWIAQQFTDWGVLNAGAVLSMIPLLLLFVFLGKRFVEGLVAGATKY